MARFPIPAAIDAFVRERYENKCVVCGTTNPLDLAHLYEDASSQMAASDRLLLLCPNENQSQQRAHGKTTLPLSQVLQAATLLNAARADYWKASYFASRC